jgi:hypothetical protein
MKFLTVAAICALASLGLSLKVNSHNHLQSSNLPTLPEKAQGQKGLANKPQGKPTK